MKPAIEPIFPASARERLSLCMIVKNEARCLARALQSAAPWAAELVVVDTGSSDETVAIAEAHGARVVHFVWCDDFAAARNASLEAASRPWALVLDADEELVVDDAASFAAALLQEPVVGFNVAIESLLDGGGIGHATLLRLFRRDVPGMRYVGAIHEQVVAVRDGQAAVAMLQAVRLRHDGYMQAVAEAQGKAARNVKLSQRMVDEQPDNAFAWFNLATAYMGRDGIAARRAFAEAHTRLRAAGTLQDEPWVLFLYQAYARELAVAKDERAALALLDEGLARFPLAPDLRYLRGQLRHAAGQWAEAAADFAVCLTPEAARSAVVATPGAAGYAAETGLALCRMQLGEAEAAEAGFERAAAAAPPAFVVPHASLGTIRLQRGEWARALPHLQAFAAGASNEREPHFKLGWCLYQLERYDEAEQVLLPIGDWPPAQELLGKVLLDRGDGAAARGHLDACGLPSAGLARGWAAFVTGAPEQAASIWEAWLRAGAADWGTKDTLARFLFLLQGGRAPDGPIERPAEPLRDMDRWFRLLLRHRRFDEIEAAIGRAPRLGEPLWRPLRKLWGATLLKEGYRDVATTLLLDAQREYPDDPEPYYWLGVSSLEQHMPEEARTLWQTCLRLAPDHLQARQALSLLN